MIKHQPIKGSTDFKKKIGGFLFFTTITPFSQFDIISLLFCILVGGGIIYFYTKNKNIPK